MVGMQTQERTEVQDQKSSSRDAILIEYARAGDAMAFEVLVRRYHAPLFHFICHFLGEHDLGEYDLACDVLQHVFLQFYLSLPTIRTNQPLRAWLYRVAHNRCIDELRRKRFIHFSKLERTDDEENSSPLAALCDRESLPEEVAERHDLQQRLSRAISALPPKLRAIVVLRYASHLSFSEIGQTLGIPEATAKTYFHRARPLLRASLTGWEEW
jgi:RNA polymerase sigma-70 factor, ECF subfamily